MVDDQLPWVPEAHDVRVQVGKWVYYVRAVRRGERLPGSSLAPEGVLVVAVFHLIFGRVWQRWQERQPWKVGVVRFEGDRWGATGRARVVHKELVAGPAVPTEQLADLADRVRAGEFAAEVGPG